MKSGLSRKEAILKIASEKGVEIKPGLHIPPNIGDVLSELKKEIERPELPRSEEAKSKRLYELSLFKYTHISGGGKYILDRTIESHMKQGLSKDEAIYALAEKERLL